MKKDHLPAVQQESLLTLLCFDKEAALIISSVVDVELFDSDIFRDIADKAVGFIEVYKEPIGDHLADAFADIIEGEDERKANLYGKTIQNIWDTRETVNREYLLGILEDFVDRQSFKRAITEAGGVIQRGGDVEEAKSIVRKSDKNRLKVFNVGTSFMSLEEDFADFVDDQDTFYRIGIEGFEEPTIRLGPSPKTLLTLIAPHGRGKSWFLIQCGRWCVQQRLPVLHVTLEMSEKKTKSRYVQNMLSISKYESEVIYNRIRTKNEEFAGFDLVKLKRPTFRDKSIKKQIMSKVGALKLPLIIKEFPTSHLTMRGLEAYLDNLEKIHKFVPKVIIVDYADLMAADAANLRIDLSVNFKLLRGLMVERNISGITVAQSNRLGEDARVLTTKHLAEDYTKTATSDMIVTYSQLRKEKELGIARLWIAKNRDNEDNRYFLISSSYRMGQFCVDCKKLPPGYWDFLEGKDE